MATLNQQLDLLLARQRPAMERAWRQAISDVANRATLNRIVQALRRNDIEAAIDAIGINRAALSGIITPLSETYASAGAAVTEAQTWRLPDMSRTVVRFDLANPRANAFISEYSTNLVTNVAEESREALRTAIRAGYEQGRGPLDIARDLTGRIGKNGRRTGGIVGLDEPSARYVQNMRARLASGDPVEMRKVLGMTRRDRRLDGIVRRAIEAGKPVTQKDINRLTGRYSDRLLALRGERIARTETATAVETARLDAFKNGMDEAGIPDYAVERTWRHGGGRNDPRDGHVAYSGTTVTGVDTPFVLPSGARMMHPHDASLGAGAGDIVNCTCRQSISIRYDLLR
jgi:hypothetical protein